MTRFYIRLVVSMLIVLVVSVAFFMSVADNFQKKYFRPGFASEMEAMERALGRRLEGMTREQAESELELLRSGEMLFDARLVDGIGDPDDSGGDASPVFYVRPNAGPYLVALRPDAVRMAEFEEKQGGRLLFATLVVGVIIALAGVFMVMPLVRKLRAQERTILKIAEGDLDARAPVDTKEALGRLGHRINEMADRIKRLLGSQRELIHAVSHEMRTPTARIGFGLELLSEARTDEERNRRIDAMHRDLAEMDALLEELMTFLRFDDASKRRELEKQDVELRPMVARLVEKTAGFRPDVTVKNEVGDNVSINVNPRYFPRVLENLLRNALRHARTRVRVDCESDGEQFLITVDDDGEGVPPEERTRIFEPFVRLDSSRNRDSGGSGLGLAISKRIVRQHGGGLHVETSDELGGARFVVELPG